MRLVRFIGLLAFVCTTSLVAVATQSQTPAPAPLSANALDFLVGTWEGTLTYLDDRDNKSRNTIKATLEVSRVGEELRYQLSSVDSKGTPTAGQPTTVTVGPGDTVRFGKEDWRMVSTRRSAGRGSTEMRLGRTGTEANKSARIERIYTRDTSTLRIRTEVLPDAQGPRVIRNEYVLTISTAAPAVVRTVTAVEGLSADRLRSATALLNQLVADGKIAGAVAAVARDGKLAYLEAVGLQDLATRVPMSDRSMFRIYSMTKPITAVAAMILFEEGRFRLDDPVAKYLPEFNQVRVVSAPGAAPRPPSRPLNIEDLLLHTSGLSHRTSELYRTAQVRSRAIPMSKFIENIVRTPLMEDPGTRFRYSESTTVVGRLVEIWSGKPFDTFLEERIFRPLRMVDTVFTVGPDRRARLATVYTPDPSGGLAATDTEALPFTDRPALLEGAVGLVSTVPDFLRFSQMLVNQGELDGVRVLNPETVVRITSNGLADAILKARGGAMGWGLANVNVLMDTGSRLRGEYGWDGTAGTIFWNDPTRRMVTILMTQSTPANPDGIRQKFKALVEAATQ
jgi:CubicO group peptidase (beta-lactamase class C family)